MEALAPPDLSQDSWGGLHRVGFPPAHCPAWQTSAAPSPARYGCQQLQGKSGKEDSKLFCFASGLGLGDSAPLPSHPTHHC